MDAPSCALGFPSSTRWPASLRFKAYGPDTKEPEKIHWMLDGLPPSPNLQVIQRMSEAA
jgi:hypothetical protein